MPTFFKNIHVYNITGDLSFKNEDELSDLLEEQRIVPCGKSQELSIGWDDVLVPGEICIKADHGFFMNLRIEKKNIPSKTLKEEVEKYIKEMEQKTGDKVNKKAAKEDVKSRLLINAFVQPSNIEGYIDTKNKLLVVNTSSAKNADTFTACLRTTLGSLPIEFVKDENQSLMQKIKPYLQTRSNIDGNLSIGHMVKMVEPSESGKIGFTKEDIMSEQVASLLNDGREISDIELEWMDRYTFVIGDNFVIKGIKPKDTIFDVMSEVMGEDNDKYNEFMTSASIMLPDFSDMVKDLLELTEA